MKNIKIIEVKSELGAGTRGSSLGPDAIKVASLNKDSNLFAHIPSDAVDTESQLLFEPNKFPYAIRIDGIAANYERISDKVCAAIKAGEFPIMLLGDHSSAGGTIAGVKMAHPENRLGLIWIDAHADIHSPYTSPSGNVHGMPVATAIGEDNKECQNHDLEQKAVEYWEKMKNIGNINPKVDSKDIVYIGLRSFEKEEKALMDRLNIKAISIPELRQNGVESVVRETLQYLDGCDDLYVSFDVDSMDPSVSIGTGTPVEAGLSRHEAEKLVTSFIQEERVNCLEFTEVNPTLDDKKNRMAEVAFDILEKCVVLLENE